ncbi:hypothetical protein MLD38_010175 [Melastoma candidum]|uniref:Uncharacterized protein n=1 Tax=Melastoma candidum TaxID=119954 RepID=A0ACB9QYZ6_9MYRT|nr:hypothetical protein MLD38_010175 [Melastoma candidum]
MAERRFRKGARVEVTSPDHCLRGTLFPAKIISHHSRKRGFFLVEYNSLVTISDKPSGAAIILSKEEISSASGESSNHGRTGSTKGNSAFGTGMIIEVRSDDDGFEGAWYSTTIMDRAGSHKFLIRYQNMKVDENSSKPLMEEVEADLLRPFPPEAFSINRYEKHTKVDAYFNYGWWEGEVTRVLDEMKYKVYFEGTDYDMAVHHADLRPHQDWLDGEWVM